MHVGPPNRMLVLSSVLMSALVLSGPEGRVPIGATTAHAQPQAGRPTPQSNYADELTDFGAPPQSVLQANVASPTPTTIPGARVVTTSALSTMLHSGAKVVLIDAWNESGHLTIPPALRMPGAGTPGTFNDAVQQQLSQRLRTLTNNNLNTPLVFFCTSARCWESYNASLRAMQIGFTNVSWYRGGLASWQAAGLQVGAGVRPPGDPVAGQGAPPGGAEAPMTAPRPSPAPTPSPAQVNFVEWVDPTERSFSVAVPQGWHVSGGTHWNGQTDARNFVRAQSPDGKLRVFIDDPDILGRQVPNPVHAQMGWVEGRVVQSPTGPLFIQRFLTGSQYAQQHVTWRLCQKPRWIRTGDSFELSSKITAAIQPYAGSMGGTARASAGETTFTCDDDQGYVSATTVLATSSSGPIQVWGVYKLSGFVSSDPMRSMQARYVMEHMMATFTVNPSWEKEYQRRINDVTGRVIGMQNALSAQARRISAANASTTSSRLNHPNPGVNVRPGERKPTSVNTTLGTKRVCDALGRCQSVSTNNDTYFIDHGGNAKAGRAGGAPPDNSGVWSPTYTQ
jgi:PQQ-dependent catabolism-associated CXXCW motif protein